MRFLWIVAGYAGACFAAAMSVAALMQFMLPDERLLEDATLLEPSFVAMVIGVLMVFPALVTIIPAEIFVIRYATFYATAGLIWAGFLFFVLIGTMDAGAIIFPTSGAVGGLTYWLIAGRQAGLCWEAPA